MEDMLENWNPRPTRPLPSQDTRHHWELGPLGPLGPIGVLGPHLNPRDFRARQVHSGCNFTSIVLTKTKFWNWCEI